MNTSRIMLASLLAIGVGSGAAAAQDLGALRGLAGDSGSSLIPGSAGNAAGVIEYCVKNNYLNADAATAMKDKLLSGLGTGAREPAAEDDYRQGARGILRSPDGESLDLAGSGKLKKQLVEKACDAVLEHAGSLL